MASVQHEHLLPLVGICMAKSGVKIVTILRPMGSLLNFLQKHESTLSSKYLMIYCYQISSVRAQKFWEANADANLGDGIPGTA